MIRSVIAGIVSTVVCALFGWLWFGFFADTFFNNPLAFALYGVIALAAGLAIGITIGWTARERQQDAEEKRFLDAAEHEFRGMSFIAKSYCLTPAREGVRSISGEQDMAMDFSDDSLHEAQDAGFILVEQCGTHQHRIRATKKLADLARERPELFDEAEHDFAKDFTENYVIQQTMNEDGTMSPPRIVDKLTGEERGCWELARS